MKRNLTIVFSICFIIAANIVFSAEIPVPAFVPDALFNAVSGASAGDVFILQSGGVYPNTAAIPVQVPVTIKTADGAAEKAIIVLAANASNVYPGNMFNANASLTLINFIADGQQGDVQPYASRFINRGTIGAGGKIHVDGIEVSRFTAVSMGGDVDTLICENSFFNGNISNANGWGGTWDFQGDIVKYVRIQNNTFMFCTFGPWLSSGWGNYVPPQRQNPTLIIDHNTLYNINGAHGPTTMFARTENVKFTNNLYINGTYRPNEFFSDKYVDFPQNDDVLTATNVISHLGPKGMWLISVEMVDSAGTVMDMHANNITYTSDVLAYWTSKGVEPCHTYTNETKAAIVDESVAYFAEEVTFVNAPAVPMYAIQAIADYSATANTATAAGDTTYMKQSPFQGFIYWNTDFSAAFDFRTKAEMDMSYNTDAASYTAADGGFPLGDLNWFPDKKAEWETWLTDVELVPDVIPVEFDLKQNYPNPFNPSTTIYYSLKKTADVHLTIYNTLGQPVKTLVQGKIDAGSHSAQWDGTNEIGAKVVSGIYYYRLVTENQSQTMKMVLIK